MININLMPDDGSKKGRKGGAPAPTGGGDGGGGGLLVAVAILVALVINGGLAWHFYSQVQAAAAEVEKAKNDGAAIQKKIDSLKDKAAQVKKDLLILQNQKQVLDSLDPVNRVLWCEKLNMLAALTPPDVFINSVDVTEDVKMVETEASKKAREEWRKKPSTEKEGTKEPKPQNRPLISYHVEIEGLATGHDNIEQFNNMLAFVKAMREYTVKYPGGKSGAFMDGFLQNMDFKGFEATTYEDVPVHKFHYVLTTKDQNPPATPALDGEAPIPVESGKAKPESGVQQ